MAGASGFWWLLLVVVDVGMCEGMIERGERGGEG